MAKHKRRFKPGDMALLRIDVPDIRPDVREYPAFIRVTINSYKREYVIVQPMHPIPYASRGTLWTMPALRVHEWELIADTIRALQDVEDHTDYGRRWRHFVCCSRVESKRRVKAAYLSLPSEMQKAVLVDAMIPVRNDWTAPLWSKLGVDDVTELARLVAHADIKVRP